MRHGKCFSLTAALLTAAPAAFAEGTPLQVNPAIASHPGAPASANNTRSGTGDLYVRLHNSCYGTNLRHVSNPLAPNALIEAKLQLVIQGRAGEEGKIIDFWVKYPAEMVTAKGITDVPDKPIDGSLYGGMDGMKVGLYGNMVQIALPAAEADITLRPDGTVDAKLKDSQPPIALGSPQFIQDVISCEDLGPVYGHAGWSKTQPTFACGAYMGKDGPLNFVIKSMAVAADNSAVDIAVSFPGQTGFCGGYFSPLMLFFDEARPKFSGVSRFELSAATKTYWVEAGAPGYFLALDRNGNGSIDDKDELFGDQDSGRNGFLALRELDSNRDGVIDGKDAMFKKLLLWNDRNGDGKSAKAELSPAHKRVVRISLSYRGMMISYGRSAETRQVSEFWFRGAKGREAKGVVEDVWFSPTPGLTEKAE